MIEGKKKYEGTHTDLQMTALKLKTEILNINFDNYYLCKREKE